LKRHLKIHYFHAAWLLSASSRQRAMTVHTDFGAILIIYLLTYSLTFKPGVERMKEWWVVRPKYHYSENDDCEKRPIRLRLSRTVVSLVLARDTRQHMQRALYAIARPSVPPSQGWIS